MYDRPAVESEEWRYFCTDDLTGTIRLPVIDCPLKLADVYDRVTFPPAADEAVDTLADES